MKIIFRMPGYVTAQIRHYQVITKDSGKKEILDKDFRRAIIKL